MCAFCGLSSHGLAISVHSGYNTGLQLCLCNDCYCQMVGENPDEYTTEGQYDDLSVKLRLPSSNLIRIPDDLIAPCFSHKISSFAIMIGTIDTQHFSKCIVIVW